MTFFTNNYKEKNCINWSGTKDYRQSGVKKYSQNDLMDLHLAMLQEI